jgi:hypothetical protein
MAGEELERRFPCDEPGCAYRATQSSHLKRHKRTHSGERPYACDEPGCEYTATTAFNLKSHKRTHSGERLSSGKPPRIRGPRGASAASRVPASGAGEAAADGEQVLCVCVCVGGQTVKGHYTLVVSQGQHHSRRPSLPQLDPLVRSAAARSLLLRCLPSLSALPHCRQCV